MAPPTKEQDLTDLAELNQAYLMSDQNSDVARYEQFLAPDGQIRFRAFIDNVFDSSLRQVIPRKNRPSTNRM